MREKRITKIKKGDPCALDSMIREYYPQIYAFTYRKLCGDDVAKDITQEVFVRFIQQLPMYRNEGKTLHYLYRIASNLCHDYFRDRKRKWSEDLDEKQNELYEQQPLHETILEKMQHEELMLYIQSLSEVQQDVILLKYFHQLTFKEISECCDTPISTIKTRHHAALKKLQQLWKEGEQDEN